MIYRISLIALSSITFLEAAEKKATAVKQSSMIDLFFEGGLVMYPIAILSVIAAALCILFLFTIRQNAVVSDQFMDTTETMIRARDLQGLANFCRRQSECMARITQRVVDFIIANPTVTLSEVREITESEGSRQTALLGSRVTYLSDIGNITPMLGLLGTVFGIIKAFSELAEGNEGVRQLQLSSGISGALIATAAGLAVAIPTMMAYAFFRTKTQRYIGELESASSHLVALLQSLTVKQNLQSTVANNSSVTDTSLQS
jgi:biopolymer transport protein ExbB